MVAIGLISYPLYLWHWPLLSFTHIVQMEKPSSVLRFMVLALSFLLAWITYYFIERNLRYRKHELVAAGLFVSLLMVGLLGYQVLNEKGYPLRVAKEANAPEEIGLKPWEDRGWVKQDTCLKKFGNFEFCLMEDNTRPVTAMLIGDSHANHLYPGLVTNVNLTGGNLLNLGVGACLHFVNNTNDVIANQEKHCQPLVNRALKEAIRNPSVHRVFLGGIWGGYLKQKKRVLREFFGQKSQDKVANFEQSMRDTLQALSNANKEVIFVMDVPNLGFNVNNCFARPWRLSGKLVKSPCAVSRGEVDAKEKPYREIVMKVIKDFPSVKVWDPADEFCDRSFCWAIKEGQLLYRDGDHLNEHGSMYLGNRVKLQSL
jgi:predicted permease